MKRLLPRYGAKSSSHRPDSHFVEDERRSSQFLFLLVWAGSCAYLTPPSECKCNHVTVHCFNYSVYLSCYRLLDYDIQDPASIYY